MSIYDTLNFQPMLITEVFESVTAAGKWFDLSKASTRGPRVHPYVARSGGGNGIGAIIPRQEIDPPNVGSCITVGVSTSTVFYQPVPFYTSKEIQVLRHHRLNELTGPVLVTLLRQQMGKFQWGNGASLVRLKATKIMVPVTVSSSGETVVDWDGLSEFGRELFAEIHTHTHRARPSVTNHVDEPPELTFEPMLITDVFESIAASKAWYDKSALRTSGISSYPFISRTKTDNGVDGFCSRQEKDPEAGNAITIGLDTQTVGFQPVAFYTSQNIQVLRHPNLTPATAAVLMSVIKTQLRKFSWGGNGATLGRLKATKILIPTTFDDSGETIVDWDSIDCYGQWLIAQINKRKDSALPAPVINKTAPQPELANEGGESHPLLGWRRYTSARNGS